jgi:chemotaxis protein methyltransferase CheR
VTSYRDSGLRDQGGKMIDTRYQKTDPRPPIPDSMLCQLSGFVAAQMGLHFPKERWRDLERGIASAAHEFGFDNVGTCIQRLLSSPLTKNQVEILASHLTVGETYFFREGKIFQALEERIFPELIRYRLENGRRLRIWSAGCASGEEPYSIAIVLSKMISDLKDWNITILATDINPRFLKKAAQGLYTEWSFRDTPKWVKEKYFKRRKDAHLEILPHIKKMTTFSYLNLVEDTYPSLLSNTNAMDIIFCRNVLMYFAPELAKKVVQNLYHSLLDGGWLIVGSSELSQVLFPQFGTVNFADFILYKKQGTRVKSQRPEIKAYEKEMKHDWLEIRNQDSGVRDQFEPICNIQTLEPVISEPTQDRCLGTRDVYAEASALYEQGSYEEAANRLLEQFPEHQDNSKVIFLLARSLANLGRLAEALDWCEKAIAADTLNPALHYLHGTILQEQGILDRAMMSMRRVLYINQNFVLAHFALGNLNLRQGKVIESKKHFENALSLLNAHSQEDVLPESEGMTVGRLMEVIKGIGEQGMKIS